MVQMVTARPSQRLVTDHRITDRAFRIWCWLDQLYRARQAPVTVTYRGLAAAFDCDHATAMRAVRVLLAHGYLHREPLGPGAGFRYRPVRDPGD